jgi:hypothetical protein
MLIATPAEGFPGIRGQDTEEEGDVVRTRTIGVVAVVAAGLAGPAARAADIDREPINYSTAAEHNAVGRLQQRLNSGRAQLAYEDGFGYLRSLLRELNVPVSSQALVFSKTSLQRERIKPSAPRAVYFGDDAYVGFCQNGVVLEVTAIDPQLGPVFYSLDQEKADGPKFTRQTDNCLLCHAGSMNQGFPGLLLRSLYADEAGYPVLASGSYRIDQTSPLSNRWGGWYVSGTSGKQMHMGNMVVRGRRRPEDIDNTPNLNVTNLGRYFKADRYLSPHSDIVALMVLEHQAEMHNVLARASYQTRMALRDEAELNKALGRPADYRSESTTSRIKSAGEPLVKYLLFSGEAHLSDPVKGTSGFAEEFVKRGPHARDGRSLRDLDLRTRLFKYPCSYVIYSEAFDALPGPVKDYALGRMFDVLSGKDSGEEFAHLTPADRKAILDIVRETKPGLPAYWRAQ